MVTFTGGDFTGERAQAFANGAAERLFKPMGMDERVGVIVRILENSLTYIGNPGR